MDQGEGDKNECEEEMRHASRNEKETEGKKKRNNNAKNNGKKGPTDSFC